MDRWSGPVIEAAKEVHRVLGPGLFDTVYKLALAEELRRRRVPFARNRTVPIRYRGLVLATGLQLDLVVGGSLIVDVRSVERLGEWHRAQLLTHLRFSGCPHGLLLNFNVSAMRKGVWRARAPRPP
ncbi:MAG TPA: GxxExxY protein [Myxococcales bacterium]|jgi:GxxExxY protein|nr:GxxExxY protein [Myxococcales bacterium]